MRLAAFVAVLLALAGSFPDLLLAPPALAELRPLEPQTDRFSALEQRIIREYYGVHPSAEKPPRIDPQTKLGKGSLLPPDAVRRALPAELEDELPPLPEGRKRVILGTCVLLIETKTNTVLDILPRVVDQSLSK